MVYQFLSFNIIMATKIYDVIIYQEHNEFKYIIGPYRWYLPLLRGPFRQVVLDTILCDKVCQWLMALVGGFLHL